MRSTQLEAMLEESGLVGDAGDDLRAALAPLQQPDTTSPAPSAALAALFPVSELPTPDAPAAPAAEVTPLRTRGRRAVSGALVLALAGVGATGLSAAANTLPAPWQHHVSEFSRRYLPFDLPEPRLAPPRTRQPLSGAPQPRTAAERLSPAPKHRHVPRADAALTARVPQRAVKDADDVRPAATPTSGATTGPMTTTRPSTRHPWSGPAPTAAPTPGPTAQPKSAGQKPAGPQKSAEIAAPSASPSATFAAAPPKNGKDSKDTGIKDTGVKDTGAKSANPQDTGKRNGGQDGGQGGGRGGDPTVTPLKTPTPVPVTGPITGPVEGPTTGPVLDVVRVSGGKDGPGDETSGPGDLVESGQHEQAPKLDHPSKPEKP